MAATSFLGVYSEKPEDSHGNAAYVLVRAPSTGVCNAGEWKSRPYFF